MRLDLAELARAMGSAVIPASMPVAAFSTDSRSVAPGALFFALRGERFDGNDFVQTAFAAGAAAAVADRPQDLPGRPVLPVADSLEALQSAARLARSRYCGRVVAVTGSAGKTTTKEIIAALLGAELAVGKSSGNFNNHIGLPLSILHLAADSQAAVLEIGMNHAGEIRGLAGIARPDVAVVTNAGWAHIENFDSPEGIALAKRELVESLPADGVAVLNADDPRVARFAEVHPGRSILFGLSEPASVRATDVELSAEGVRFRVDGVAFESELAGIHGVRNILAGIAVARAFGIGLERLVPAAHGLQPGKMRGERLTCNGITVWNDSYNSNPDAARAMLEVLRDTPARRRIAVLGEMLELGRWSEPLHRDVGRFAVECGVNVLVGIRGAARSMVDAAISAGIAADAAYFFGEPVEAGLLAKKLAAEGDAVLFKGSRATHVELALQSFLD
ncbi:MAG: UDP-N-acetylmuramoyl-tripeptide--D-alanyl-D-alanine ligase [Bryobacterales bacterium]|nr:UDP-N-acetylmuramoyl-tripeptide--D-alanyl-D-alanine ligase [Bryobacterales bacterium]